MDIPDMIKNLTARRDNIDASIRALQKLLIGEPAGMKNRRGRKFMGAAERIVVSNRMKRYWAQQRQKRKGASE